jgi:cysteine desulfurase
MEFIYLDHASTTPLHPRVEGAMAEVRALPRGNPASPHARGREARALLEGARERVARLLGRTPGEVFFVRGGTESDNLAVQGRVLASLEERVEGGASRSRPPVVAHSALEHSAVRESAESAGSRFGAQVEVLAVLPSGQVDQAHLDDLLTRTPHHPVAVVSVQLVNGETGLVLEVAEVIRRCRERGVVVHVDAVQGVGRVPFPWGEEEGGPPPHLLSFSAHKLGGPGGAGVLVRETGVPLVPLLVGGGQEGGVRPGTVDVEAAVGTAEALALALEAMEGEARRLAVLRDGLQSRLVEEMPDLRVHGGEGPRAPHILNLGVPGVPRDLLPGAMDLEGVAVSAGSACRSGATSVSPVLRALYGQGAQKVAPLRISLGWSTTSAEVDTAGERILRVLSRVRGV